MQKVMSFFITQRDEDLIDWDEKVNKVIADGWRLVSLINTPSHTENFILAQAVFEKVENPKKSIANSMIKTAQSLTSGRTLENAYLN